MKQQKIRDGWSHPQSKIVLHDSGTPGFKGTFVHLDVQYSFSVREQKPGVAYRLRGQIQILNPYTARPMKDTMTALRVRENNPCGLKKAVVQKAAELSVRFDKPLNNILRDHAASLSMYPLQLLRSFGNEFLKQRGRSADYRKNLSHQLVVVCEKFGHTPMNQITSAQVRQVCQGCGKTGRQKILLAGQFFAYCRDRKAYPGDNPLEKFIKEELPRKKRGDTERLQRKAGEEKVFSIQEKECSLRLIQKGLEDGRNMGVLLIGDGGLSPAQAARLKWQDIVFDTDDFDRITLLVHQADNAGYTHCYDHPVFPYAGHLLHLRYEMLSEEFGIEAVQKLPVVSHAQDPKKSLSASAITAYCKQHLRTVFAKGKNPMKPISPGVQFLQNDYANRLSDICGMVADPSAVRYLRGMSLTNDVTADSYRSFSGEDGQQYLYRYLCRGQDFAHLFQEYNTRPPYTIKETKDGKILYIPGKPGMRISATLIVKIDESISRNIMVSSEGGVEVGSACFL